MPPDDETSRTATDVDTTEVSPSDEPVRLAPGRTLGRYEIGEVIGAGGMGVVYRARDPELKRDVAIKVVAAQPGRSQARLLAEARAMAKLDHASLVPVFDVGAVDDAVYIVMPFITGGTLHEWIHAINTASASACGKRSAEIVLTRATRSPAARVLPQAG